MPDRTHDNLVLFPKTLDYYQILLTRMLESEHYGDAKSLLMFLLQCGGDAERHHTEWQALLGWLENAFPDAQPTGGQLPTEDELPEPSEADWIRQRLEQHSLNNPDYIPTLLKTLQETDDPEQQLLIIGQLQHLSHEDVEPVLREWLSLQERHPSVQFSALQVLRKQGAVGEVALRRDGETIFLDIEDTPLRFADFPPAIHVVAELVQQSAEVFDPTLAYFAEEMWKECVQTAYGTPIYQSMISDDESSADIWAAALHQVLLEKLHSATDDHDVRERYGISGTLRFRYEQALRWLRQYAAEPRANG
jgi:hypothetical protein